jgi:sugar lactone lactonase YvrE
VKQFTMITVLTASVALAVALSAQMLSWMGDRVSVSYQAATRATCLSFSPDGAILAVADPSKGVLLVDVETQQVLRQFESDMRVTCAAFSPDGSLLATSFWETHGKSDRDWGIEIRDASSGQILRTLTGHRAHVSWLCFSRDGKYLASAGYDDTSRLWDVSSGEVVHTFEGQLNVASVAISHNGQILAESRWGGAVELYDVSSGQPHKALQKKGARVDTIAFSPDDRFLAGGDQEGAVMIWDLDDGLLRRRLKKHDEAITSVAFSPDGRFLATAGWDRNVLIWDVLTCECCGAIPGTACVVFCPSGEELVSIGLDNTLVLTHLRDAIGSESEPSWIKDEREGGAMAQELPAQSPVTPSDVGPGGRSSEPEESTQRKEYAEPASVDDDASSVGVLTETGVNNAQSAAQGSTELRVWTDYQGRQVRARYLGCTPGTARLEKQNGEILDVPLEHFSPQDLALIRASLPTKDDKPRR